MQTPLELIPLDDDRGRNLAARAALELRPDVDQSCAALHRLPRLARIEPDETRAHPLEMLVDRHTEDLSLRQLVAVDHAAFHYELHALKLRDVAQRIAGHGDEIRELPWLDAADPITPTYNLGVETRCRHDRRHRRFAELDADLEFFCVVAV